MSETQTHEKPVTFSVDGRRYETSEETLTPVQIMEIAGIDPSNHYLTQIEGRHQTSYKDAPNEPIRMRDEMVFISTSLGPTPVS